MITVGLHKVTCASIEDPALDEMLMGETVDVLYSDPPWGNTNMKYWKTIAKRMTGVDIPQITHEQLYDRMVDLIRRYVRGHVFIETGLRWEQYVSGRLAEAGVTTLSYPALYESGSKNCRIFFWWAK